MDGHGFNGYFRDFAAALISKGRSHFFIFPFLGNLGDERGVRKIFADFFLCGFNAKNYDEGMNINNLLFIKAKILQKVVMINFRREIYDKIIIFNFNFNFNDFS